MYGTETTAPYRSQVRYVYAARSVPLVDGTSLGMVRFVFGSTI